MQQDLYERPAGSSFVVCRYTGSCNGAQQSDITGGVRLSGTKGQLDGSEARVIRLELPTDLAANATCLPAICRKKEDRQCRVPAAPQRRARHDVKRQSTLAV